MKLNNNDETRTKLVEDIYRQLKNKSFENNFNEGWYLADLELAHFNLPKQSSIEIFKIYAEKAKKECGYYQAIKKFSAILISQNIEIPEELRSIISQILREDIKKPRGKRVTNFNQRNTLGLLAFSLKLDRF